MNKTFVFSAKTLKTLGIIAVIGGYLYITIGIQAAIQGHCLPGFTGCA